LIASPDLAVVSGQRYRFGASDGPLLRSEPVNVQIGVVVVAFSALVLGACADDRPTADGPTPAPVTEASTVAPAPTTTTMPSRVGECVSTKLPEGKRTVPCEQAHDLEIMSEWVDDTSSPETTSDPSLCDQALVDYIGRRIVPDPASGQTDVKFGNLGGRTNSARWNEGDHRMFCFLTVQPGGVRRAFWTGSLRGGGAPGPVHLVPDP
jgi:hypothetical protein